MRKQYAIYIMTNKSHAVLYTGVTDNLKRRAYEHKEKLVRGFTTRYNVNRLVYYELCPDVRSAIAREKQVKAGSRQKKTDLINKLNPKWNDLYDEI